MEFSSPLAALRPQPCPTWSTQKDMPPPRSPFRNGYPTYGPGSFDFKTMSMQQTSKPGHRDYFTLKPVRGSSPTSTLTADLDANFHIDKSPQAPTPRRSLFTADFFKPRENAGQLDTPPIDIASAMTPEIIPSSSPGMDAMDISPLPHKAPYFIAKVTLPSPTPEQTPDDELISPDLLSPASTVPPQSFAVQAPTFLPLPERKRPATRPSLTRTKGLTTTSIPQRPHSAETELPPFRFGNVAAHNRSSSTTPSLLGSFTESPSEESGLSTLSMLPPPRRPSLSNVRLNGSPSTGHVRKPSAGRQPFVRPQRKIMRRSLSMFQHPDDVMREEQNDAFEPQPTLPSAMDIEIPAALPKLPHFVPADEPDSLPRISQETMAEVLDSKYSSDYEHIMIIDCRFEYEYNGGHIDSAVNFNDKHLLANQLFNNAPLPDSTLLIFHCEYSVHRAPLTAKYIRSHDRTVNIAQYPKLTFPEMYILDGGYSKFFASHRSKCFPQNYVEMNDQRHEQACERGMARVKQRQRLFRHQTFAFGETHDDLDNSPTAPTRGMGPRSQSTFSAGESIIEGIGQSYQRRMASY